MQSSYAKSAGLWVGLVAVALLSSLAMVQIRCKLFGIAPCGDWPQIGYTWHFWPPFILLVAVWATGAWVWSSRRERLLVDGLGAHGLASAPMLGLVVAWSWFALTGSQFHAPSCTTPVLCHDAMRLSIAIWSGPWIAWGLWNIVGLWRASPKKPYQDAE